MENRATEQRWFELQQAQVAYQDRLLSAKLAWPHFQDRSAFAFDHEHFLLNNKCFFLATTDEVLLAFLNSNFGWWQLSASARIKRGGYIEAEAQYVSMLVLPEFTESQRSCLWLPFPASLHVLYRRFKSSMQREIEYRPILAIVMRFQTNSATGTSLISPLSAPK